VGLAGIVFGAIVAMGKAGYISDLLTANDQYAAGAGSISNALKFMPIEWGLCT
jgi:hypothetical protein